MLEIIKTFFIGIFVGIANVIPGVSGGTLVVVFNIYDKFVNAITFNVKKLIKNWRFVVPILLGMASGILVFSKVITILYSKCPVETNFFFTGLILGSIPLLINYIFHSEYKKPASFYITAFICVLAGIALIIAFYLLNLKFGDSKNVQVILPDISIPLIVKLFAGGILGAVAMIVPGISGSLIMLILGIYPIIISAIPTIFAKETMFHAVFLLLPNGIGILFGLLAGAKLLSFLLKNAESQTYAVILGLILGSVFTICPRTSEITSVLQGFICLLCTLCGFAMAYFSSRMTKTDTSTEIKNN